jgi:hypothetical protein
MSIPDPRLGFDLPFLYPMSSCSMSRHLVSLVHIFLIWGPDWGYIPFSCFISFRVRLIDYLDPSVPVTVC